MTTATMPDVNRQTTRFGAIDVAEDLIITLPEGIIGFEDCTRYVVLHVDAKSPFRWLQSLDDGAVAFPIIDPWEFKGDYDPAIADADADQLGLTMDSPKLVFAIVTVPRTNPRDMTANLLGPLVINPLTRTGKQVIVTDEQYTVKHSIMQEINQMAVVQDVVRQPASCLR